MGLYIKGMKMPSSCYKCPCCDEDYDWCEVLQRRLVGAGDKDSNCPLVEVKEPHGRLIDADGLKSIQSADYNSVGTIQKWIEDAPTVIEAEGEEP